MFSNSSQNDNTKSKLFFSIIIPTLNEEKYLPLLLNDLSKQSFGRENFEVIHVDGGSDDKTLEKAQKFAQNYPSKNSLNIKSIVTDVKNVSTQRNAGAKVAVGEWIIFMDADNRLDSYFLDGIKYKLAKNPKCDCFTTWVKAYKTTKINLAIIKTINFYQELYLLIEKPVAVGSLIGVKNKIFKYNIFDESQLVYEDAFFVRKIYNSGLNFIIFKEPKYYYSLRRMEKDGIIKLAGKAALLNIRYLQNKDFSKINYGYKMEGGGAYTKKTRSIVDELNIFIKNASKKQLNQAKKLLNNLKELQV